MPGVEIQKMMFDRTTTDLTPQLLQVKAFKPDMVINIGVGQPLDLIMDQATTIGLLPDTPMLISYDAPARPQFWQLHEKKGDGIYFIAYYSPKSKLSDIGERVRQGLPGEVQGGAGLRRAERLRRDRHPVARRSKTANSTDPKALIKALETGTFKSWPDAPVTFPQADGVLLAQLGRRRS